MEHKLKLLCGIACRSNYGWFNVKEKLTGVYGTLANYSIYGLRVSYDDGEKVRTLADEMKSKDKVFLHC